MAELELRWITRVCLDRTGEKSESVVGTAAGVELSQPNREPVKNDLWQRDGITMITSVPWDTRGSAVESMTGNRRKHVTNSLIQDETPSAPAHLLASLRVTTKCQKRLGLSTNPNVRQRNSLQRILTQCSVFDRQLGWKEVRKTTWWLLQQRAHTIPFPSPLDGKRCWSQEMQ